jgi:hypothetical protein
VTGPADALRPPSGIIPVTVPIDLTLVRRPGLAAWAGAVSASPAGFEFTLLIVADTTRAGTQTPDFALHPGERDSRTWLEVRFADGRARAADLNACTPFEQPEGPSLLFEYGEQSDSEGWNDSRWWVTPLPPPGPVSLAIHLDGQPEPSGVGHLDGQALIDAARRADVVWTERS